MYTYWCIHYSRLCHIVVATGCIVVAIAATVAIDLVDLVEQLPLPVAVAAKLRRAPEINGQ